MSVKPNRNQVNETENVVHRYQCVALIKMYPHMNIDDCRTCTSREMELNAKSNQSH